ncbi:MAG: pyridoxamine 5'-phosphate oxidase family protein [Sulfuricellaceae bacterium]|nr:pyridoxamine 5'-phosphate oxidase family protein [Sulfuricellaceae bacterium]
MSRHVEIEAARSLLLNQSSAALATLSAKMDGHPFVSSVDYLSNEKGEALILISQLAEHTRNIQADARVSLLVQDSPDWHDASLPHPCPPPKGEGGAGSLREFRVRNVQASPRLTLIGLAEAVSASEMPAEKRRYLSLFPDAEDYFSLDFGLYLVRPIQLRYVGGFGIARWIAPGALIDNPT